MCNINFPLHKGFQVVNFDGVLDTLSAEFKLLDDIKKLCTSSMNNIN